AATPSGLSICTLIALLPPSSPREDISPYSTRPPISKSRTLAFSCCRKRAQSGRWRQSAARRCSAHVVLQTRLYGLCQRLCDPLSHVFASLLSCKNDLAMLLR